ncbi:helicase-related protein [Nonomuraea roseola]|uniref:helicase-related protein n=1 Tax=Nonomuraea roseola TaxID=46179 RepID=UPI0031F959EA
MLPIHAALPDLIDVLEKGGCAVLTAPPGTGKTTVVPLALADAGLRVVVAEPRRLAVRAAAHRMDVGYTIKGERRTGARKGVEVVTTGVLLQRLQRDQELPGVDVVMIDECHERHLDADTALAFLLDVRETLRPDLRLVAASATADTAPWSRLLGDAPVVSASGVTHPVEIVWAPPARPVVPPHGLRVDPALLAHVADVVRRALATHEGDVLCFLPGVGEITRVAGMLQDLNVLQVHGQAPARVQDAVLRPSSTRRVVLATSVAESSLTVPGVRVVVDSGLAREPRTDHARGLGSLTTVHVSRASADQRAGRAGREGPGTVYRCWTAAAHARLAPHAPPEIALADLTGFALQAACWGAPGAAGLALLDPPPARRDVRRHPHTAHPRRPHPRPRHPGTPGAFRESGVSGRGGRRCGRRARGRRRDSRAGNREGTADGARRRASPPGQSPHRRRPPRRRGRRAPVRAAAPRSGRRPRRDLAQGQARQRPPLAPRGQTPDQGARQGA